MTEHIFNELKRYVRFSDEDEKALQDFLPTAQKHFQDIVDEFYQRLFEHENANRVFAGPQQIRKLKVTLMQWLETLLSGPWDDHYFENRARIGRAHVRIALPQHYMFGAMNLLRRHLVRLANDLRDVVVRRQTVNALSKILDLELAVMLETYREAFVQQVQELELQKRQNLEERLQLSEATTSQIIESAEALIVVFDDQGLIQIFNKRCEEMSGQTRHHVIAKKYFWEVCESTTSKSHWVEHFQKVVAGKETEPVEAFLGQEGRGATIRWRFTKLPGPVGKTLLCGLGLDITEERKLSARSQRTERLAALGTMAAGLAHEIRNPLNAAHLQLTLVERRLQKSPKPDLDGALEASMLVSGEMKRLASLVQEFLQFARPQPLQLTEVDLRALLESVINLLTPEAQNAGVELELQSKEQVLLKADAERLRQVVLNLLRNAIEASPPGTTVKIATAIIGKHAELSIEDAGRGFPKEAPIFEPFFTTKTGGTGLGLAIVHRIVSDHGGNIDADSRPGRTVFTVHLPLDG